MILRFFMLSLALFSLPLSGQGVINMSNLLPGAKDVRTRIGSVGGLLADNSYAAQLLAGRDAGSLEPIGPSVRHLTQGIFAAGTRRIPGIQGGESAFFQIAAWNAELWGDDFKLVPKENVGFSDVGITLIDVLVTTRPIPNLNITIPPVVPIPEPSGFILGLFGIFALYVIFKVKH